MEYRSLGKTEIKAGVIGLGSEGFVEMGEKEALDMTARAIDAGVNFFDLYNPQPQVRKNLGKGISGRRHQVYIQGHLCTAWIKGQYKRTRELKEVQESFEEMLRLLGTDYVDVGMIHYVDREEDLERICTGGVLAYAESLKQQGYIRHIGISSHNPVAARKAVDTGVIETVLFAVNPAYDMQPPGERLEALWEEESYINPLCNIDKDRDAFHKICEAREVGITVMKAFGGGDLLDGRLSPFGTALTPAQCIHYALSRPGVASVLGGFRSTRQLEEALDYCSMGREEKDFSQVLARLPKHTFIGKCMYCGHCAPCTAGIDIAMVNKFKDLCIAQGFVPETVREHYRALQHHAGECTACGRCEKNCPFGVEIIKSLKDAVHLFGE